MAVHYYTHRHAPLRSELLTREERFWRVSQLIWLTLLVIEAVLLTRFGLKILGANSAAPFADLMYSFSDILLAPFRSIVPAARAGRSVLEWTNVLAMLVYWLIAWLAVRLTSFGRRAPSERIEVA